MNKKLFIVLGILLIVSLSIFIFGTLYQNELPKFIEEINNSSNDSGEKCVWCYKNDIKELKEYINLKQF